MIIKSDLIVISLMICLGCKNEHLKMMGKFRGMWKLDKYESFDSADNKWHDAKSRLGYSGYIIYDGSGHVGVQLFPPGFRDMITFKNIDSLKVNDLKINLNLYNVSFAYFANCNIISGTNVIEHHIVSSNDPGDSGITLKRSFEFRGDTLILTAKEIIDGHKVRLRWIKISER